MYSTFIKNVVVVIVFVLAWVNSWLVSRGFHPLPVVSEDQVSYFITFVVSVWTMLRENPFKRQKVPADEEPSLK